MALSIERLLDISSWRAFDIDAEGNVLAGADESGSLQLVELTHDGAATPLTALPGVVHGRYLPGQRCVVMQYDTDGDERGQLSMLPLDEPREVPATLDELKPLVRDTRFVHQLLDVLPGRIVYATNRRNGVDFDVVIHSVVTGTEEVVYDRGGMVTQVTASAGGRYVALTVPGEPPMSEQLIIVDTMPSTAGEHVIALTEATEHAIYREGSWLPDDSALIVTTNSGRDFTGIARINPGNGARRWLVCSDEHDLTGWVSPDGSTLLVRTNDNGAARFALHDASTGQLCRQVPVPEGWCGHPLPAPVWSPDSRAVALTVSTPTVPGDVLLIETHGTVRPLTESAAQLNDEQLVTPTARLVPTADDKWIPCFVYSPREPDPATAGSAVLVLHGGPESQSVRSFSPIVQALAAQGHTVLVPNVRGSTGYGKGWYSADDGRKRLDSVADLAALHDWLPSLGIDPHRVALWGGSYGGYLVLAGLAFQPDRWAAGVDIVGISALMTFLGNTAAYRRAHREREYGSLHEDADFLRAASPMTRVEAISAPLFVVHGANDPRVPLSEAEQIVSAVRGKGVECELLVYEDEGHGLAKRANRKHAYPRATAFLARNLSACL